MKSSRTKSYLSIVSFFVHWKSIFFLPTFKEFGVNSIYKYASTTRHKNNARPSLYNISAKSHLNCLQNLLFQSSFLWVFVAIFGCSLRKHPFLLALRRWPTAKSEEKRMFSQATLVVAIFLRLLFDHKQLCIWPLELSEHYEPGNHSKNQRLKPLRNCVNVRRAKFDGRDLKSSTRKLHSNDLVRHSLHKQQQILLHCGINLKVVLHRNQERGKGTEKASSVLTLFHR